MGRSSARNRRSNAIAALIATAGSVRLRDLAQELGVSEMTLRRDAQFPDAGFACLGGYVVSASAGGAGAYDFDHALRRQVDAKRAAARQALALLRPGMRVFVDCGSTTTHLASLLTADTGIAVITHSLPVAKLLTGALAAIAGMLLSGRINAAKSDYGASYLLQAVLIAVLGGTNPAGGRGSVVGVTLALISLVLLASGFQMMRVSNHLIDFIWGAFLILVVALNAWRQRRGTR